MFLLSLGGLIAIIITDCGKRKILIGKDGFRIPFLQRLDKLTLRVF